MEDSNVCKINYRLTEYHTKQKKRIRQCIPTTKRQQEEAVLRQLLGSGTWSLPAIYVN